MTQAARDGVVDADKLREIVARLRDEDQDWPNDEESANDVWEEWCQWNADQEGNYE